MSQPTTTLKDMCKFVIDCPHFTPAWTTSGFIVVRNQNIRDGKLDLTSPSYTHEEDFRRRNRRAKPQAGDIIITREAPMGEVCIVPAGLDCCIGQRQVLLRPKDDIDGRYLFYALRSEFVRRQIFWNEGTGSTVSNVRIPVLEALKIPRLGGAEFGIGEMLGALDDKMDLNRRTNETLEAMARAIFKDWFIDFGPVRAKAKGRQPPGLAADIADLFPDALDDEDRPVGWELVPLSVVCDLNPSERLAAASLAPYLDMAALATSGTAHDEPIRRAFTSGTRFRDGDTLLARITPCLENGKTCFVQGLGDRIVGWGSTEFIVIRPKAPLPPEFGYLLAREETFRDFAIRSMTGTSGRQRVQTDQLATFAIANPSARLSGVFGGIVRPWFDMIRSNTVQAHTLASLRNLLLPKLMSGEIRIRDAERAVEAAA